MLKSVFFIFSLFFLTGLVLAQSISRDERIIGEYILLYQKDGVGEIIKDNLAGKNYSRKYTKSGQVIIDPQIIKDDFKRHGITEPRNFTDLPVGKWSTFEDRQIETSFPNQPSLKSRYIFSGDTLIIVNQNGNAEYLLRLKDY
jgi:hemin uptake protein HemP